MVCTHDDMIAQGKTDYVNADIVEYPDTKQTAFKLLCKMEERYGERAFRSWENAPTLEEILMSDNWRRFEERDVIGAVLLGNI